MPEGVDFAMDVDEAFGVCEILDSVYDSVVQLRKKIEADEEKSLPPVVTVKHF